MDPDPSSLPLFAALALVAANALLTAAEFALIAVRRSRIEQNVRLGAARSARVLPPIDRLEELVIETHVANVLDLLDMLGDEVDIDRGLELYGEMLPMDEHVAATVANRVIARHDAPRAGRYTNVFRK
jgi:hypothetical protein